MRITPKAVLLLGFCILDRNCFACMDLPSPTQCSLQFTRTLKSHWSEKRRDIRGLERRIRFEKKLLINEVSSLAAAHENVRSNIDLIKDEKLRAAAEGGTPIAFAKRLERLRSKLTDEEWADAVTLWADYIARSADLWEKTRPEDYCGLRQEGDSLGADTMYIFAWPFILSSLARPADGGQALADGLVLGPLSTTVGVVGLGSDVITFIPNAVAGASERLRDNIHMKRSAEAFRKFANLVKNDEKTHG